IRVPGGRIPLCRTRWQTAARPAWRRVRPRHPPRALRATGWRRSRAGLAWGRRSGRRGACSERRGEPADEGLQYLDARVLFVFRGDQRPRREFGSAPRDHLVNGAPVVVGLLAVAPILLGYLVAL